ncbi:MAG TPA: hypothetical protein VMI54_12820 [Polyangiaceae bacterium]|nr:hypothetical protein [Polyangiaceae bacterium]
MGGFTALLDVAIGLSLVYLAASLFVTIVNEFIATTFKLRGKELARHLTELLGPLEDVAKNNPAFKTLLDKQRKVRSYVDPNVLAQVIVASLSTTAPLGVAQGAPAPAAPAGPDLMQAISNLPDSRIKSVLWTLAQTSKNDVEKLVTSTSQWVDRSLTVLGESYKKQMQWITLGLGIVIAVGGNIDTLQTVARLYSDKELRDDMVVAAEQYTKQVTPTIADTCAKLVPAERAKDPACAPVQAMATAIAGRNKTFGKLPLGWQTTTLGDIFGCAFPLKVLGWFLTAIAISLGAPFWFDLLNRFVNLRHTIERPTADGSD